MATNTQQDSVAVLRELIEATAELASAEKAYRHAHDHFGDGHIEAGRAWDRMRKAGIDASNKVTRARALQSQQVASADRGEAWMDFDEVRFYMAEHGCCVPFGTRLKSDGRVWNGKEWMRYTEAEPTPPSPAESAAPSFVSDRAQLEQEWCQLRAMQRAYAAPSGVSDADVQRIIDRVGRENSIDGMDGDSRDRLLVRAALKAAFAAIGRSGEGHSAEWCAGWNAHLLATAAQPQPGRVEGMVWRNELEAAHRVQASFGKDSVPLDDVVTVVAAIHRLAAPTAGGQEADHG